MNRLNIIFIPLSLALAACGDGSNPYAGADTALTGATLIDGTGAPAVENSVVLLEGDTISCAGTADDCPIPSDAIIEDVTGKYLAPGLIDAHMHFSQTGWLDGRPDGIDLRSVYPYGELVANLRENPGRFYQSYLCSGVVGVMDVGGFRWTIDLEERAGNHPLGLYIRTTGPLITHAPRPELQLEADQTFIDLASPEAGRQAVQDLAALGADAIKVWYLNPPEGMEDEILARFQAVADETRAAGIPLVVHATGLDEAWHAVRAGAHMLVHSVMDQTVPEAFLADLREAGTIYAPTLIPVANWGKAVLAAQAGEIAAYNDPMGCVDPWTAAKLDDGPQLAEAIGGEGPDAETVEQRRTQLNAPPEQLYENLRLVHAAGVPIVLATDAGNPLTLHGASVLDELTHMEAAGMPAADIIVAATRNGAQAMGLLHLIGTIEAGKKAEILVLAADPRETVQNFQSLETVIHRGQPIAQADLRFDGAE